MDGRRRSSVVPDSRADDGVLRVDDSTIRHMSVANPDIPHINQEARNATANEVNMTLRQAVKLYPRAIIFSIIFSTAVVMEGYDFSLMGSFYALPPFKDKFEDQLDPEEGGKLISAQWQTGIQNGVQVGSIIGLYLNGIISEWIGYKKTMIGSLFLMIASIFIPFFAENLGTLLAGALLQGLPWGRFPDVDHNLRGGNLSHRAAGIPDHGRYEDAKKSLLALTSRKSSTPFNADEQVSMMRATTELEKAMSQSASYLQCFRGIDARRTEIASMAWVAQAFCGAALMGYSTQFYERAGLSKENAFNMSLGQYAMGAVGTMGSWFLMIYAGRRVLYVAGLAIMTALLLIIGFCGLAPEGNIGASWAVGSMLLIYTFVYDITVSHVCYSLVAEIPSTRLKIKTVVLARNFYNIGGIINNALMPQMIGVNAWNWGAKTGFFWAGLCALLLLWAYFRLPEPKGRTYGELDVLFEHKVPARKFKTTRVDQFSGEGVDIVPAGSDSDSQNEKVTSEMKE